MASLVFLAIIAVLCVVAGFIAAVVALARANAMQDEIQALSGRLQELSLRIHGVSQRVEALQAHPETAATAAASAQTPPPAPPAQPAAAAPEAVQPPKPAPTERLVDISQLVSDLSKPAAAPACVPPPVAKPALTGAPACEPVWVRPPQPPPPIPQPQFTRQPGPAPAPSSDWWSGFEERVGQRWMTWLGVLAVVLGALFFLQYAIKHGWVSQELRIGVGLVFGAGVLFLGDRFVRKKMRALGQGLMGGGLAILYATLYTGFGIYHILPSGVAFGGMAIVSAAGLTLSVLHDALPVSFLAVLGGFLTPVVVSTGTNQRDALCAYILVLDLSVLGIAFFRQWRALLTLAFVGTAALFLAWFHAYYEPAAMTPTLLWVGAFYASFLLMPFAQHLRRRAPLGVEQFGAAMAAAVCTFLMAHRILWPTHPHILGFISLGMSACYAALGVFSRRRAPQDERSLFGFTLLSVTLLTISLLLHLKLNGITMAWAVEAVALLLLGYRFRYAPLRYGGAIVMAVALCRVAVCHWPLHPHVYGGEPFHLFLNAQFGVVFFVALAAGAFALVGRLWDMEATPEDKSATTLYAIVAGIMAVFAVQFEVREWIALQPIAPTEALRCWQYCFDTLIVALGAAGFLAAGTALRSKAARVTAAPLLILAGVLACFAYSRAVPDWPLFFNMRFAAAGVAAAVLFAFGLVARRKQEEGAAVLIVAGYLATLLLDVELTRWTVARPIGYWVQPQYTMVCMHLIALLAGVAGFMVAAHRWKAVTTLVAALVLAAFGVGVSMWLYLAKPWEATLFLNEGFLLSIALLAAVFVSAVMFGRTRKGSGQALGILAGYALLVLVHCEIRRWLGFAQPDAAAMRYDIVTLDVLIGTLGAAAYLASGLHLESKAARMAGLAPLGVAAIMALRAYALEMPGQWALALNARFTVALACALMALVYAFLHWRRAERGAGRALYIIAIPYLLLILSLEDFLYWRGGSNLDPERARWVSQMSLSVIWALYAIALVAIGFWRRTRAVRLAGLALFGITAAKLVIVDIAHIQQVYRIISFVACGLLMIGVSYLYHRIEKQLHPAETPEGERRR